MIHAAAMGAATAAPLPPLYIIPSPSASVRAPRHAASSGWPAPACPVCDFLRPVKELPSVPCWAAEEGGGGRALGAVGPGDWVGGVGSGGKDRHWAGASFHAKCILSGVLFL